MSTESYQKRLEHLAKQTARDPHVVEALLNTYFHLVQTELVKSQEVNLPGFGSLKVSEQEATTLVKADGKLIDLPSQPLVKFSLAPTVRRRWSLIKVEAKPSLSETAAPSPTLPETLPTETSNPSDDLQVFAPETEPQQATHQGHFHETSKPKTQTLTEEEKKAHRKKVEELTALFTLAVIFLGLITYLIVNQISIRSQREISVKDIFVPSNTFEEVSFTYSDTLKTLAEKYYGTSQNWPFLYFENLETIVSPEQLFPGKDHVYLKYQTNSDLAELYFNLYLKQSNVSPRSHLEYLSNVYTLKSNRIRHLKDSLPEEEKKFLGL